MRGSRIVVCAMGGTRGFLELPSSRVDALRDQVSGGERCLYELAAAAASLGFEVELRGHVDDEILRTVTGAAGAVPVTGLPPRRPLPGEVVVLPEVADHDLLLSVQLSGASGVIYLLAPPGLVGWPFLGGWSAPDPLTVAPDTVVVPSTFRAIDALGLHLWVHAHGLAEAAEAAGVATARWIGSGMPIEFPEPVPKTHDVAVIEANRWYPLAAQVAGRLPDASVLRIQPISHAYSLSTALAPARILLFPSRVEGASRICREARLVGTVPIVLDSNPYVTGDDWGEGVVLVRDLDAMVAGATRLLAHPEDLERLSTAGRENARRQEDWPSYVERVSSAISALHERPDTEARASLGQYLYERDRRAQDAMEELNHANQALSKRLREAEQAATDAAAARAETLGALEESRGALSQAQGSLRDIAQALGDAEVAREALLGALSAAERELGEYRARRIVRLVDDSPLRLLSRAIRRSR